MLQRLLRTSQALSSSSRSYLGLPNKGWGWAARQAQAQKTFVKPLLSPAVATVAATAAANAAAASTIAADSNNVTDFCYEQLFDSKTGRRTYYRDHHRREADKSVSS
jgi:hypothetical protein